MKTIYPLLILSGILIFSFPLSSQNVITHSKPRFGTIKTVSHSPVPLRQDSLSLDSAVISTNTKLMNINPVSMGQRKAQNGTEEKNLVNIYPNPASHVLYIEHLNDPGPVQISISGLTGETILSESFGNEKLHSVSLNGLSSGIYILTVTTGAKRFKEN